MPPVEEAGQKDLRGISIGIFRLKEGKVIESWIEGDFLGMYRQLGMELKPMEKK